MKTLLLLCAAVTAFATSGASALPMPKTGIAVTVDAAVKVSHRHRHGGLFANWCAYNCYLVSPCARGSCLGRYHYSRYPYDQDLPFHYRWDRDASAVDNVFAFVYPYTGEPLMRIGERTY